MGSANRGKNRQGRNSFPAVPTNTPMNKALSGSPTPSFRFASKALTLERLIPHVTRARLCDQITVAVDKWRDRRNDLVDKIAERMTIVVVAHRLSTVRLSDIVYVLDQGRIVETGRYDELLASKGRFSELHDVQFA